MTLEYQVKWNAYQSHMNTFMTSFLRSEQFTDVVLCTMDGSQINAHKIVLSSCSVYLNSLFADRPRVVRPEGGTTYVLLPSEITVTALRILVEYMYLGESSVTADHLVEVIKAAKILKIYGLWSDETICTDRNQASFTTKKPHAKHIPSPSVILVKAADQTLPTTKAQAATKVPVEASAVNITSVLQLQNPTPVSQINIPFIQSLEDDSVVDMRSGVHGTVSIGGGGNTKDTDDTSTKIVKSKTNAESCRDYYNRKKAALEAEKIRQGLSVQKPIKKTGAERKRVYRMRKKMLSQLDTTSGSTNRPDVSTVSSTDIADHDGQDSGERKTSRTDGVGDKIRRTDDGIFGVDVKEEYEEIPMSFEHVNIPNTVTDCGIKSEYSEDDGANYIPLRCELCADVFAAPEAWYHHVTEHRHTPSLWTGCGKDSWTLLRCDLCQKHFLRADDWISHVQNIHTGIEGVQGKTCIHCNDVFPTHALLQKHTRMHTDDKPYFCGLCPVSFGVKSNLMQHLITQHLESSRSNKSRPFEVKNNV